MVSDKERKQWYITSLGRKEGFVSSCTGLAILFIKRVNPLTWIYNGLANWLLAKFSIKKTLTVEVWVLAATIVEISILWSISNIESLLFWAKVFIVALFALRLLDIVVGWTQALIVAGVNISNPRRLLILTLVNYVELNVMFTTFNKLFLFDTIGKSLAFTVGTLTTIGSNELVDGFSFWQWAIYLTEIAFGLIFIIVIIVRALSFLEENKNDKANTPGSGPFDSVL